MRGQGSKDAAGSHLGVTSESAWLLGESTGVKFEKLRGKAQPGYTCVLGGGRMLTSLQTQSPIRIGGAASPAFLPET